MKIDKYFHLYSRKDDVVFEEIEKPELKKGKWIDEGFYADGHGAHAFRCSECGGHIIEYDADPFCKWCGADMRGEEDNIPIEYFESGGK
jgi:hypothetical protein